MAGTSRVCNVLKRVGKLVLENSGMAVFCREKHAVLTICRVYFLFVYEHGGIATMAGTYANLHQKSYLFFLKISAMAEWRGHSEIPILSRLFYFY